MTVPFTVLIGRSLYPRRRPHLGHRSEWLGRSYAFLPLPADFRTRREHSSSAVPQEPEFALALTRFRVVPVTDPRPHRNRLRSAVSGIQRAKTVSATPAAAPKARKAAPYPK